ncbi:MAG TPA: SNF2-related protein [bacterium]|nr:SNF2-related protein [bacterium]HPN42793.1 SNF2-related protein [bacterium]
MSLTPYHAKYFAYELTKRSSSNSIQKLASTLVDAQVDLNPHQVEAALFAFNSPLSKGAILADEVGLGKTIEAGLVISQKWAERKRKILIIVPANLRKQWNQELLDKFFLSSTILETASFNESIKKGKLDPFDRKDIVICSYHFARAKEAYIKHNNWDLVVIDEAHRLRNVYKPANVIANTIKNAVANAPKLLLTATPLQNSLLELYGLVSIIDDFTFGDLKSYKNQFSRLTENDSYADIKERLKPVCKRTLRRQVLEYINFTNRTAIIQEFYPTKEEQQLYDLVSEYLQRDSLYALPASQRHLMTLILRRLLASSTYAISGTLEALANKLQAVVTAQQVTEETLFTDFESFDQVKEEWLNEESSEPAFYETPPVIRYTEQDIVKIRHEVAELNTFKHLADSIQKNSKGEVLLTALTRGFAEAERLGGPRKAIIFTESRRTQRYLKDILEQTEFTGSLVLFNGTNTDPESRAIYQNWLEIHRGTDRVTGSKSADLRAALIDYFRDHATIMIATEAAAEGINLQFCSLVVNYDLPWNPQRIEQRIGRCHRYGQKYDVVVVNFLNKKNAADQRVYELLSKKFKLFEGVFGASDEVLGSIESGVDFEKRIAEIYQKCRTEAEIQRSFDALQQELDEQIQDQYKNARQQLLENFDEEVHEKLKFSQSESQKYLNRYEEWLWQITQFFLKDYAEYDGQKYSFTLVKNPFPQEIIHPGPYRIGKNIQDANIYRINHPLAQRIIGHCKQQPLPVQTVVFDYTNTKTIISILKPHKDKSGWLKAVNFSISSFESEDHVLLAGCCDDGTILDVDACRRMFSLVAQQETELPPGIEQNINNNLDELLQGQKQDILQENAARNAGFFDLEMGKLEKWADDLKTSLELELKELDKEIKFRKTEAKKISNLEAKVEAHRKIKDMEKKRNALRMQLFQSQDEVDKKKEDLITEIELRLKQSMQEIELFTIRWKLV